MRKFTIYVELDKKGKISALSELRLAKYCEYLQDVSLHFIWIHPFQKIHTHTVRAIVNFERKYCAFKKITVHNCIISNNIKASIFAKHFILKYKFSVKNQSNAEIEKDYVRMCFGNDPYCCAFNSCLGNCVYIDVTGTPGICPFIKNDIKLNTSFDIQSIYDVFYSQTFKDVLKSSIEHRNNCKKYCEYFNLCKGGCPLIVEMHLPNNCKIKEFINCVSEKTDGATIIDPCLREQTIVKVSNMYRI